MMPVRAWVLVLEMPSALTSALELMPGLDLMRVLEQAWAMDLVPQAVLVIAQVLLRFPF